MVILTFWLELFSRGLELYAGMGAEAIAGSTASTTAVNNNKNNKKNTQANQCLNEIFKIGKI